MNECCPICEHDHSIDSVCMVIKPNAPNPFENIINLTVIDGALTNPFGNWVQYECTAEIEYGPTFHFFKPHRWYYLFPSFWWNRICNLIEFLWLRYLILKYRRNIKSSVEAIEFSGE